MKHGWLWGWACLLAFGITGCNGWDDDSEYAVETRANFYLARTADGNTLIERRNGEVTPDLNALFGIARTVLSEVDLVDNRLWLAAGGQQRIIAVNPETKALTEEFTGLPVRPHHFAVGREQIIATDTLNGAIAFIRLRNGEVVPVEFEGKPGRAIYSNGRFYTQVDDSLVYVYDEQALTPRAQLNIGARITEFQFDRFNNLHVLSRRDTTQFSAIIASNADYISRINFQVTYDQIRYTPYFATRYVSEYLTDLQLEAGTVQTPQLSPILAADIEHFEVNFFAGVLHYFRNDSLFRYDLNAAAPLDSLPFPYAVVGAWHQLSTQE
ncbi:MAG: hypothetical protein AAGN35_08930 [Bacteroidota bacterium]